MKLVKEPPGFNRPRGVSSDDPLVIHRHDPPGTGLIVFVHGLGGSSYGSNPTWGVWPAQIFNELPEMDVGMYQYRTLHRRRPGQSLSIDEEAGVLAEQIAKQVGDEYYRVFLIGHSLGGLLSKAVVKHLIDENDIAAQRRLVGLMLIATPQAGSSRIPGWLHRWSKDFRALGSHSDFVTGIAETFTNRVAIDGQAHQAKAPIPTWAIRVANDAWVDRLSAVLDVPNDRTFTVKAPGGHKGVVKETGDAYEFMRSRIQETLKRSYDRYAAMEVETGRRSQSSVLLDLSHCQLGWGPRELYAKSWIDSGLSDGVVFLSDLSGRSDLLERSRVLAIALPCGYQPPPSCTHETHVIDRITVKLINQWVQSGRGLLLMGYYAADTHHFTRPTELSRVFGIEFVDNLFLPVTTNPRRPEILEARDPGDILSRQAHQHVFSQDESLAVKGLTADRLDHAIVQSVALDEVAVLSSSSLDVTKAQQQGSLSLLLTTPPTSAEMTPAGERDDDGWRRKIQWEYAGPKSAPVLAALETKAGNGRVVITGTWKIATVHNSQNQQLIRNCVQWLQGASS